MNQMYYPSGYQPYPSLYIPSAHIKGGPLAPGIRGVVYFYDVAGGTEVCTYVEGLPPFQPAVGDQPPIGPFGYHIHEYGTCEVGDPNEPFMAAGEHWNPDNQPHGYVSSLFFFRLLLLSIT